MSGLFAIIAIGVNLGSKDATAKNPPVVPPVQVEIFNGKPNPFADDIFGNPFEEKNPFPPDPSSLDGRLQTVKEKLNDWLQRRPDVKIVSTTQTILHAEDPKKTKVIVTVFYKE